MAEHVMLESSTCLVAEDPEDQCAEQVLTCLLQTLHETPALQVELHVVTVCAAPCTTASTSPSPPNLVHARHLLAHTYVVSLPCYDWLILCKQHAIGMPCASMTPVL